MLFRSIYYKKNKNKNLFSDLEKHSITKLQNYIPLYQNFFSLNENNYNNINLNHKYHISDVNENIEKNNRALIVIPILNGASRIKERITNIVANCSPSDFEIVIISDGSRDNTYEEALKHSKLLREKGWKLDVIQNELNIGRAASHNKAVEKSKNEIIIFTDLDTRFSKTFPQNS